MLELATRIMYLHFNLFLIKFSDKLRLFVHIFYHLHLYLLWATPSPWCRPWASDRQQKMMVFIIEVPRGYYVKFPKGILHCLWEAPDLVLPRGPTEVGVIPSSRVGMIKENASSFETFHQDPHPRAFVSLFCFFGSPSLVVLTWIGFQGKRKVRNLHRWLFPPVIKSVFGVNPCQDREKLSRFLKK